MELDKCEECEQRSVSAFCETCHEHMCEICDQAIHRKGKRSSHFRVILCRNCQRVSKKYCLSCSHGICDSCTTLHNDHDLQSLALLYPTLVYWDLGNYSPDSVEVLTTYYQLKKKYPKLHKLRIFGKGAVVVNEIKEKHDIEIFSTDDENDVRIIFIDISLQYSFYGHFVLISKRLEDYKKYLMQIIASTRINKLKVTVSNEELKEINIEEIQGIEENIEQLVEFKPADEYQESIEVYCNWILNYLKVMAYKGKLVHDTLEITISISSLLKIPQENINDLLKILFDYKLITIVERKYSSLATMKTINLNIHGLNLEVLHWAIQSLKVDEMLPTERAIQARIKEAFDYKVSNEEWKDVMDLCFKSQQLSKFSSSENSQFSFFSSNANEDNLFIFRLKKYKDKIFHTETFLLFLFKEKWLCYDKFLKCGDVLGVKNTESWRGFCDFFREYFASGNYEERAIPGGRYGCAQFLKNFGNEELKNSSVGKLNYLVQLAIDEDLLRYQKNLLVWTSCLKAPTESESKIKLGKVKVCVESLLQSFKDGISLAQLPGLLSKQINFQLDLQELGFAKLKDLLISISGVQIVKKANKHQYAILLPEKRSFFYGNL